MAVNKVIYDGETLMDLTSDTVTPETLMEGETAHNAAGEQITGTAKSGGGGSVQSDWNINDINDPAYVKNRTHYSNGMVEDTVLDNVTVDCSRWGEGVYGDYFGPAMIHLLEKNAYIVDWNGTTYVCKAGINTEGNVCIGNAKKADVGKWGNGEPFCIVDYYGYYGVLTFDNPGSHTFSITHRYENVATIPIKYIKDMYGEGDLVETAIWGPGTLKTKTGSDASLGTDLRLSIGQTYIVDFDGTVYECVAWENDGGVYIGNGAVWDIPVEDTGEPFICDGGWVSTKIPGEYVVSISTIIPEIIKVPAKYVAGATNLENGEGEFSVQTVGSTASGYFSYAGGRTTTANGYSSCSDGYCTVADNFASHALGKYNKGMYTGGATNSSSGDVMAIGNGYSEGDRSNAFRVTYGGATYGLSAFNSTGADYAEFFEWADFNPNADDRVGYFVTLDGKHIRIAKPGDYILGIVSGQPCIIGNSDEDWLGRWEHDEFGRFIKEDVETPVTEKRPVKVPVTDKNGNQIGKLTKTEMQEVETGEVIKGWRYKANPDYDPTQQYVERKDRREWDCVGMLGVLAVRDDGTCQVNGFCTVADGGIATKADSYIPGMTYRVIERVSENVVKVVFR